ncbi:MAG: S8 family serine peptidase [Halobacteriaceae archaeon]
MVERDRAIIIGVILILVFATIAPFVMPILSRNFPAIRNPIISPECSVSDKFQPEFATRVKALRQRTSISGSSVNISVGIIDPNGFAINSPCIDDNIVETQSFWPGHGITNNGRNAHGTVIAKIITAIAPETNLYLANFNESTSFIRAVKWAIQKEVDVLVVPVAFYGKPNDGTAPVSQVLGKAVRHGITVVAPSGNIAQRHWEGIYNGTRLTRINSQSSETRLYLSNRDTKQQVQIWIWWNQTNSNGTLKADVDLVLYRDLGNHSRQIAVSHPYPDDNVKTNELLTATIGKGKYYLRIRGPVNTPHIIELISPSVRFKEPVVSGSILAPATANAHGVIAVGAARGWGKTATVMGLSSQGPTNDGRRGVDIIAPGIVSPSSGVQFSGTSVAVGFTGGVVALLHKQQPTASPEKIERILQNTAFDIGSPGIDIATGYGMISPKAALAANENQQSINNSYLRSRLRCSQKTTCKQLNGFLGLKWVFIRSFRSEYQVWFPRIMNHLHLLPWLSLQSFFWQVVSVAAVKDDLHLRQSRTPKY